MLEFSNDPGWEAAALQDIASSQIPCASYADVIFAFVKLYSGGPGAPWINFLDAIQKEFGTSAALGEEFWRAITYTEFSDKLSKFPLVRIALALVNLTSNTGPILTK